MRLSPLPMDLHWLADPERWSAGEGALTIVAGPGTDWFADPSGERAPVLSAPALAGEAGAEFQLSAGVAVEPGSAVPRWSPS